MVRIAVGLEYDGSLFRGWQKQFAVSSVQASIENALSKVADQDITVVAAGRTDAGVHASAQVIHFDTSTSRDAHAWVFGGNTQLPPEIRLLWAKPVPITFDARRSALRRHYRYLLYNHPIRPSLLKSYVGWYYKKLDYQRMRVAAQYWLGEHDFSSFRAAECQSTSPIRHVTEVNLKRQGDLIIIDLAANAFLHHMVRNMVGTLIKVGSGQKEPIWIQEVLLAKDRCLAGPTATANGLYLAAVDYPVHFGLPQVSDLGPWFLSGGEGMFL